MLKDVVRKLVPGSVIAYARQMEAKRLKARVARLPLLTEEAFKDILVSRLGLREGDVAFIHSSIDRLNLGFPFYRVLALLQETVGPEGTILFPTYPRLPSYEFLKTEEVFDVRKSASYTGVLTEFARRQKKAIRSLHPTKSVCAIGKEGALLTATHQDSPYPYDSGSPYHLITRFNGKIVGLGVGTWNLSFVHCAEDYLGEEFPVMPYHDQLFRARCINYAGEEVIVPTYAHDMRRMNHDIPRYMRSHVAPAICEDIDLDGMNFFRADSVPLFDTMVSLARRGITIYPARNYKK
jgi:aminoglycoside 3-N-acetyltransferase